MKPRKHADLIIAWANGAEIQVSTDGKKWFDYRKEENPGWDPEYFYRIKPEPKPDVIQYWCASCEPLKRPLDNNLKLIFDGETGQLKLAEVL